MIGDYTRFFFFPYWGFLGEMIKPYRLHPIVCSHSFKAYKNA